MKIKVILKRELQSFFLTPTIYLLLGLFSCVQGLIFSFFISVFLKNGVASDYPLQFFFGGNMFFWIVLLVTVPLVTMKLFSEEFKTGTIETLMTAPVNDLDIVLAKYLVALSVYIALWIPSLSFIIYTLSVNDLDLSPVLSGYLGIFLTGMSFSAVGIWASSLSANSLISAFICFVTLLILVSVGMVSSVVEDQAFKEFFTYLNLGSQMAELGKGIIDTRTLLYHLSVSFLGLFATIRNLEARRISL